MKTIGDAILAEFPSALEAVRYALDAGTRGHAVPKQRIESRIGIDVDGAIATGGHIHGDGRGKIARRFGVALISMGLIVNGCAADPTPECAQVSKDFEEALPSTSDVHLLSVDVLPAIVAGVALAVVERLPDDGQRQRCYDEIMRARFYSYPPYATVH